jgi:hypothetical protein
LRTITIKSLLVFSCVLCVLTYVNGAFAKTIVVDGDKSDWNDILPIILDPQGDYSGYEDLISVKITNDDTFIYGSSQESVG